MFLASVKSVVVTLVCLFVLVKANDEEKMMKIKEGTKMLMANCTKETGATQEDYDLIMAHKAPKTAQGLCIFHCILEKSGVMKGKEYNKERLCAALAPYMNGDEKKIQKTKEMAEECEKRIEDENECKMAQKLMECTVEEGKKFGFEYPKLDA